MKAAIIFKESRIDQWLIEILEELLEDCEIKVFGKAECEANIFIKDIRGYNPDLLITENLAGFDAQTLTGNFSYNMLNAKQIHLISDYEQCKKEYLSRQLSLAMFFVSLGKQTGMEECIDNLPKVYELEEWSSLDESAQKELLKNTIKEILMLCHYVG